METTTKQAEAKEAAKTILEQLGGNRFIAMTGCNGFYTDHNQHLSLSMNLKRNKSGAKWLQIFLMPDDTYTMRFYTAKKFGEIENKEVIKNVYADQLQEIFSQVTGLRITL